jgi:hypothetical protein
MIRMNKYDYYFCTVHPLEFLQTQCFGIWMCFCRQVFRQERPLFSLTHLKDSLSITCTVTLVSTEGEG